MRSRESREKSSKLQSKVKSGGADNIRDGGGVGMVCFTGEWGGGGNIIKI